MSRDSAAQKALADRIGDLNEAYRCIVDALDIAEAELPDDHRGIWGIARHSAWRMLVLALVGMDATAEDLVAWLNSAESAEEES